MRLFEPPIQKLGVFALFASQKTMPALDLKTRSKTHPLACQRLKRLEPVYIFLFFTRDKSVKILI
ncbi:MAG: hypothetical protein A3C64_00665 [Candidatus Yanofskybacteria bacterium RIFCSPHIGHO2_02_FULL_41_12]|nr:MAG: hypothetical protein A3C64_00665 [Candidatus Yanofskybacteria bacterium RIFCSPHIGHO2_02_FULL_41_12]